MERRTLAVVVMVTGLLIGMLGNALFYDQPVGLSYPLFLLVSIILLLALALAVGVPFRPRNLWPLIPLLFFALMVAVRADPFIQLANVGATLTLGALALYSFPLQAVLDEDSLTDHTLHAIEATIMVFPTALEQTGSSWTWLREQRQNRGGAAASVTRGLVFALPVVIVFAVLLGSADAVFATVVNQAWSGVQRMLGIEHLDDAISRGIFTVLLGGIAAGTIGYAISRPKRQTKVDVPAFEDREAEATSTDKPKRKPAFKLSVIEGGMVLGGVVALFGLFVVIQFAYFFGGQANIGVAGLTYAEYARRGFFELVAVSVLTLGLSLWLDRVTVRQTAREQTVFRGMALAVVGLTTVMLVSASQRMWLYEEAFGFTELRVYTHVFMLWLGVLFVAFVLDLLRVRPHVFSLGMLLVVIGYLATLNGLDVHGYIAERNIERYRQGQELDVAYLNYLSADATPVIAGFYRAAPEGTDAKAWAGQWLARQLAEMDRTRAKETFASTHMARARAWSTLNELRAELPGFDLEMWWGFYSERPVEPWISDGRRS